ncbi:hypothetical protein OKA04_18995 [Luteolibacter flavescens]|uniref:Uncharacterized protein n=1 Tax=Luteolibacter flavescens TaxID=1859460 RepID=A0ABT3FTD6_9BACT|nr:hypothetical protein [Luteolibacter flavescens]MCW1886835.1 hypothetical protein [Luteolibacter flavescens]
MDIREYAVQGALAAVQCAVIQVGSIVSVVLLRSAGYPEPTQDWPALPAFIREWGPLAFGIPAAWIIATIVLEQRRPDIFSKRETFLTGALVGAVLAAIYVIASVQAWRLLPHVSGS